MDNTTPVDTEVAVVGAGPAGLAAAIALAEAGATVALVGLKPPAEDNRTTALLDGSVRALEALGVWPAVAPHAAPLRTLRLVDATSSLIRAPEVAFAASELGLEAFGWNVVNRDLVAALAARAAALGNLTVREDTVRAIDIADDHVTVRAAGGAPIRARLLAAADGKRSIAREAAGITVTRRAYPQSAVTLNLAHGAPHDDTSTEFHTDAGPFTLVPLPGDRSSLVSVVTPEDAAVLTGLDDAALGREIERRARSILGAMTVTGGRATWPLSAETPLRFAARRVALVGEAAHVVPPIGAQGLNMGLRDGATLAELVADARRTGEDVGGDALLDRYHRLRRTDVLSRTVAIDLLNRSLLTPFLPVQAARGLGLWLVDRIQPLRKLVMQEGVGPAFGNPRLMRGEPL